MKKINLLFFVLVFVLFFNGIIFGQLTGDKIIKSSGGDYATLADAFTAINTNGVSGTVRLLIDENLNEVGANLVLTRTDLSSTNNVIIKPNTGKTPTVTFTGCATTGNNAYSGLTIDGVAAGTGYVTIDGSNLPSGTTRDLTFNLNDATAGRYCISAVGNADYITVKNCKFTFTAMMDQSVSANRGAGIRTNGTGTAVTIDNVTIQNNEIGTSTQAAGYGILINNAASTYSSNISIIENIVYGSTVPINTLRANIDATSLNINKNTVSLIGFDASAGYSHYGIWIDQSSGTVNIKENKIIQVKGYNNSASTYPLYAIFCGRQNAASTLNIINNFITNFIWQGTFTASNISAIRLAGTTASTYNVYYNSINLNGDNLGSNSGNIIAFDLVNANSTVNLKNNIIANTANTATSYGISSPTTTLLTSNYNNFYVPGANAYVGIYNAVGQKTLANWQSTSGQDANSKSKNVNFASVTDLHLVGASLGDFDLAGTPLAGITTDIDGQTRHVTFPYMGADESITNPLPVELVSFVGFNNGNQVILNWKTASEINSYGYEIQKSLQNLNEWKSIGFVNGAGNSSVNQYYYFTESNVPPGQYNYRLKIIDLDGSYKFSDHININVSVPTELKLEQNFPNPFNPSTTINYSIEKNGFVSLKVFDALGTEVANLVNENKLAGNYSINFNAENLADGIYFYSLKTGNNSLTRKMILIK